MVHTKTSFFDGRFDTPEEAVKHAAAIFNPASISDDFEVGGFVVRDEAGKYYFTYTLGDRGTGNVTFQRTRPAGHDLVAIWHSHGNEGSAREYFSQTDYETATNLKMPSYMVDYRGDLRRLDAGTAKLETYSEPHPEQEGVFLEAQVAPGVVVGKVRDEIGETLFPETPAQANEKRAEAQKRQRYNLPLPQRASAPKKIGER